MDLQQLVFIHVNNHTNSFGDHYTVKERKGAFSFTCVVDTAELEFLLSFPESLIQSVKQCTPVPLTFGMSVCHPEDCFSYKTGREIAMKHLGTHNAMVSELNFTKYGHRWGTTVEFFFPETGVCLIVLQEKGLSRLRLRIKDTKR